MNEKEINVETPNPETIVQQDKKIAKEFYSIRAKFLDKFNIRHDADYKLEDLIFDKFKELEEKLSGKLPKQMTKEKSDKIKGHLLQLCYDDRGMMRKYKIGTPEHNKYIELILRYILNEFGGE